MPPPASATEPARPEGSADPPAAAVRPRPDAPEAPDSRFADPPEPAGLPEAAPPGDGAVFDVCHVGVALRALLSVLVLPSVGSLYVAADLEAWMRHLALGAGLALPAVLLWLGSACRLRQRLARLSAPGQLGAAALLGALAAGVAWWALDRATQGLVDFGPLPALLATGAAVGALLGVWLQLRHRARAPAEVRARLVELQSRIRPHFLFNTLNSALGLVRRDTRRTEALLEDLAELFRAALADDGSVVTLADEIALARRYLAIEQIRFGERLQLHWDLDEAAAGARLPPLLLQPLVENAVRHGIEPDPAGGRISIRSRVHRGLAWVSVSNSLPAAGAAPGRATAGHGIALRNVRERLALMHDVAGRFEAGEADGRWRVQIGLPLEPPPRGPARSVP